MLRKTLPVFLLILIFFIGAFAQQRLLVIGGGDRTPDVLKKIAEESGGDKGKLLVVTWASGVPEESFEAFSKDIATVSRIQLVRAPIRPLNEQGALEFLKMLDEATGVFFTGGDQNRVMEVVKDIRLRQAIEKKYREGVFFSGTSAGTAIMSKVMITGEGDFTVVDGSKVETVEGLGLLPNIILDQHFLKRSRYNRLIGLVLKYQSQLGAGIDEDTALYIENNRKAEVLGASSVLIFDAAKMNAPMTVTFLKRGDRFDLVKRKKINGR